MSDANQALRDLLKGAGIIYIGLFVELLIAFVAQVIAARYLSVSDFGSITTGTALLDIGSIIGGLGLAAGLTRYLPRVNTEQKRSLATIAVIVTAIISFSLGALVTFNSSFIAREVFGDASIRSSIRIFGAAIPFAALLNVAVGGIRGQKESLYRVYIKNLLHPIVRFALVIGVVTYGLGQAELASAYAVPYIVSAALALALLYRSLPVAAFSFNPDLTREFAEYSLPFTITRMSSFVYRSADIFLITYFLGSFSVGIYGVAYAATSFMGMLSTAFNFLGSPIASELEHGGNIDDVIKVFESIARWLVVGSVCILIPLGVFSTEFITIVYQSKYSDGGIILTILAVGFAVKNVLGIHGPILEALGHSRVLSINSILAAGTNLILNVVLIPKYGISGAAIATVLSFALRDVLATFEVRYFLGVTPLSWQTFRPGLIAIPFLGIVAVFIARSIPGTFLWILGSSGVLSVLYIGIVLLIFGLTSTEVMVLRSIEEKYGISLERVEPIINYLEKQ
ncbi:flippase [Halorubrum ezzemoulense]|uniref:flippase n=1 Tax=Halorubrum ezzemoulense TaxID=337243 RepID=UPI00232D6E73|nr:flippase [Halorubrum ezzemoulense]MDB2276452.1 flippase [Halorubrum ezzemoulense]